MRCFLRKSVLGVPLRASSSGVSAVELALVLPLLVFMFVGLTDLGIGFYQWLTVQGAASKGAEYASLHDWDAGEISVAVTGGNTVAGVQASPSPVQVCACPSGAGLTRIVPAPGSDATTLGSCAAVSPCPDANSPGLYASVSARLTYSPMFPVPFLTNSLNLTGQAYRRLQ